MGLDYEQRTDFRAFDVLIDAIDKATKEELQKALKTCEEMSGPFGFHSVPSRLIWDDMAKLLHKQIRRF